VTTRVRRSTTAAAVPSSLVPGELAINEADGKLYYRASTGTVTQFGPALFASASDSRLTDTRTPTDGTVTTAKIADTAVTYAKLQNVSATDRLLGRSSAGAGVVQEITCTAFGRSLIDDADAATARSTLSVQPTASPAFTGAATFDNTGNVVPLTVNNAGTANSFVVNDESGDASPFVIDASGNVGIGATPSAFFHTTKLTSGGSTDAIWRHTYNNDWGVTFQQQHVLNSHIQWNWVDNAGNTLLCWKQGNVGIGTSSPQAKLDLGSSTGVKLYSYYSGGANAGIGTDLSGNAYECSIFAGGTADTHGRVSIGRRRVDTGTYTERFVVEAGGNVGIGTSSPTISSGVGLHLSGSTLRLGTARTPASSSATGNTGEICWDASYLYICTGVNTWRRIAHSSW
jgi:hypothetical protein